MKERRTTQLALALPEPGRKKRGGARKNAGRKPTRAGAWVEHTARPWHDPSHPVHVTLRVRRGVPNLRGHKLALTIGRGIKHASQATHRRQTTRRRTFRVVHFSIQPNHLHLIVEATSKTALARGMQGLASALARRVNNRIGRRGPMFADRYHAHALATPTEARNAIVYVLKNFEKHPVGVPDRGTEPRDGIDPCSSARWFAGWRQPLGPSSDPPPVARPRTWLLRAGWRRTRGPIGREERPAAKLAGASARLRNHSVPPPSG